MKKIKKIFKKFYFYTKENKKLTIILTFTVFITASLGYLTYQKYEKTKPVGVSQTVITSEGEKTATDSQKEALISDEKGFDLLKEDVLPFKFLNNITPVSEENKKEFKDTNSFRKNILLLSETGKYSDYNQIAALWVQNIKNYNFTNPQNLFLAGIAEDFMIYENYLEKVANVPDENSRADFERDFAKRLKNEFKTPISIGIIASTLSDVGLNQIVYDDRSVAPRLTKGHTYINTTQYKNIEEAATSNVKSIIDGKETNQALNIFKDFKGLNINSLYEVRINSKNGKIKTVSYIIEDERGKLYLYGLYLTEPNAIIKTVREYRELIKENKGVEKQGQHKNSLTWKNFTDFTEGKN